MKRNNKWILCNEWCHLITLIEFSTRSSWLVLFDRMVMVYVIILYIISQLLFNFCIGKYYVIIVKLIPILALYDIAAATRCSNVGRIIKDKFNYRHSLLRNIIEHCFGVVKVHFPILKLMASYSLWLLFFNGWCNRYEMW